MIELKRMRILFADGNKDVMQMQKKFKDIKDLIEYRDKLYKEYKDAVEIKLVFKEI